MARTLDTWNLDGDYHRIIAGGGPIPLDWNGNAEVYSGFGLDSVHSAIFLADPVHERLGIIPGRGVTLSNGFNEGSVVSINGYHAVVAPGGSGAYNFHIWFPDPAKPGQLRTAPPAVVQTFIRALTFETTAETLPDDYQRQVMIALSNEGEDGNGGENIQEFVTFTNGILITVQIRAAILPAILPVAAGTFRLASAAICPRP
jgi:hypothetical protein